MAEYHDQDKLLEITNLIAQSRRSQSFIFAGNKGIGKATAARSLANNLLPSTNDLLHNLLWIESESNIITIEQVRKIKGFLGHTPHNDFYRVVVIDSVDDLNRNAANALLKILEEPPAQSVLILISHKPNHLLATIRSRCSIIRFTIPENAQAILAEIEMESKDKELTLRLAHNIPGIAVDLAANQALDWYKKTVQALLDDNNCRFVEEYFTDSSVQKWWLFSYLLQYLAEKTIKTACLGHHDNHLFPIEKDLIDKLTRDKPPKEWFMIYDRLLKLSEVTPKLHLDYKSAAITMIAEMRI